jgi:acyl carrier protein
MGRVDEQVKLRGFRIEPGEIAAALLQQNGVAQAFVMVREDRPGDRRLVGYVVPSDPSIAAADLRRALKARLPEYMVPSALVLLDELPVTTSGKVDRQALPAPDGDRQTDEAFIAPRTEAEQRVAATWREVLALKEVGADDNFFDLGGHSMLLLQAHERIREATGNDLPIVALLQFPTVRALARYLSEGATTGKAGGVSAADRARLQRQALARQRDLRGKR